MLTLDDERLYRDTAWCLEFLRALPAPAPAPPGERLPVHFYWRGGPLGRKGAFALKSFLATQDLSRLEPWLWLDGSTDGGAWLPALAPHLRVRPYEPDSLARDTPLAGDRDLLEGDSVAARADAFRLLALHRHGGIYFDLDNLFLRDLRVLLDTPLGRAPFCYRWSGLAWGTDAALRLDAGSAAGHTLLERARAIRTCHPRRLLAHADARALPLRELPCPFFDPLWLHFDGLDRYAQAPFARFRDFFRPFGWLHRAPRTPPTLAGFFPGAFTYSWHGLWGAPEVAESWFGRLEAEIDARLSRSRS